MAVPRLCDTRNLLPPPLPEHFFEQADGLAAHHQARLVDLRRAISAAYYGLFHFTLAAAANMIVGEAERSPARYSLVYRSVEHSRLRGLCKKLSATEPDLPLAPSGGFGKVAEFARVAGNLSELRNVADYEPLRDFTREDALFAISEAREAIKWFQQGTVEQQEAFLMLLLFRSRT
jgi:uncharacterized protein (UPF0332 family)